MSILTKTVKDVGQALTLMAETSELTGTPVSPEAATVVILTITERLPTRVRKALMMSIFDQTQMELKGRTRPLDPRPAERKN